MLDFSDAPSIEDVQTTDFPRFGVPAGTYKVVVDEHKYINTKAGEALSVQFCIVDDPNWNGQTFSELFFVNADPTKFSYKKSIANLAQIQWAALGGRNERFSNWDGLIASLAGKRFVATVGAEAYQNAKGYANIRNNIRFAFTYAKDPQHKDGIEFERLEPQKDAIIAELQKFKSDSAPQMSKKDFDEVNAISLEDDVPF